MTGENVTFFMIFVCAAVLLFLIFSKHLKLVIKFLFNGLIGVVGISVANYFFLPMGIYVGINAVTLIVSCLLGIPGIISMYIISAFVI